MEELSNYAIRKFSQREPDLAPASLSHPVIPWNSFHSLHKVYISDWVFETCYPTQAPGNKWPQFISNWSSRSPSFWFIQQHWFNIKVKCSLLVLVLIFISLPQFPSPMNAPLACWILILISQTVPTLHSTLWTKCVYRSSSWSEVSPWEIELYMLDLP